MDADDRSDPNAPGPAFSQPDWTRGSEPAPAARIRHASIVGALAGQWPRIIAIWVLVCSPLAYVIYRTVEPTYEVQCLIRAEPASPLLYGPELRRNAPMEEIRPYLLTQIQLMTSDSILDSALDDPAIAKLPFIRSLQDPKAALRDRLKVAIVGENTYLIRVSLESPDPGSAAAIVNSVVQAYISQYSRYQQSATRWLRKNLQTERAKLEAQIAEAQYRLTKLAAEERVRTEDRVAVRPEGKDDGGPVESSLSGVSAEQYRDLTGSLLRADFELMDARARLEAARLPAVQTSAEKLRELESAVEEARRKRVSYARYVAGLEVRSGSRELEPLQAAPANRDLDYLRRHHEILRSKLSQLDFESSQDAYRMSVSDRATAPKVPSHDRRPAYMAGASVGGLVLILSLFLLRQIAARRVVAPDATA